MCAGDEQVDEAEAADLRAEVRHPGRPGAEARDRQDLAPVVAGAGQRALVRRPVVEAPRRVPELRGRRVLLLHVGGPPAARHAVRGHHGQRRTLAVAVSRPPRAPAEGVARVAGREERTRGAGAAVPAALGQSLGQSLGKSLRGRAGPVLGAVVVLRVVGVGGGSGRVLVGHGLVAEAAVVPLAPRDRVVVVQRETVAGQGAVVAPRQLQHPHLLVAQQRRHRDSDARGAALGGGADGPAGLRDGEDGHQQHCGPWRP